nr:TonB-dependent siderophore receptor [uncultured Dongia sp.]
MATLALIALQAGPAKAEDWKQRLRELEAGAATNFTVVDLQVAQADGQVTFDIPALPLSEALAVFGRQSGWQLSYSPEIASGLHGRAVTGLQAPDAALTHLLAGTGIVWRLVGERSVVLEKQAASSDSSTLAPLTVEGQAEAEKSWSPVEGYVAKQSATATKTDTPLIETPQSISVISAERLEAQGATSLGEALRYTPGVQSELLGNDMRGYGIFIRGLNANASSFYRDGLQLKGTTYSAFLPLDIYGAERLEVLRGPASVLYGQNSPGGIMNYVTKRPTEEPLHEVELGIGTFDRFEGKFDLGGPIDDEGTVLYRLTGRARDSDTQVDFVNDDHYFIAPAVTWQPNNQTSLTVLGHFQHDDAGWGVQFFPASGTINDNPNGDIPRSTFTGEPDFDEYVLDQYSIGYLFEHEFDETFTARQNARYAHLKSHAKEVYAWGLLDDRTVQRFGDVTKSTLSTVSVDNQVQAKFDTGPVAHTALAGVDFQYYDFSDIGIGYDVDPLDLYDPDYGADPYNGFVYDDTDGKSRQIGIYMQEQAKFFDKLVVQLGGRYDFARSEDVDHVNDIKTITSDEAFTGRAGLVYLFDNGLAPYASYSESFEPVLGTDANGTPFKPEEGRQYEVGVKFQPNGSNSFITVSAFDLTKQNVLTEDPSNPTAQVQTGEVRSRGIEVEGVASFDFGLDVTVAYTFLDAEITKSNVDGEEGNRPGRVGKHSASLWADYTIPEGDFEGLGLGAGVRYVGPSAGDNQGDLRVPGYALADAAIHYRWNDFRFAVNATNLFDTAYVTSCYGENSCYYGERRTVIGTLSYSW